MDEKLWSCICTGKHHLNRNEMCQDYATTKTLNKVRMIVVADGAGTLENSGEGARCAVDAIIEYVSVNFDRLFVESTIRVKFFIINHILYSLSQIANERILKSFGSTLIFVAVKDDGRYIIFHLGDGAILTGDKNNYKFLSKPMNGETKNHTFLTTTKDAYKFARFDRGIVSNKNFVVITDGCYDLFLNQQGNDIWQGIMNNEITYLNAEFIIKNKMEWMDDFSLSVLSQ